MVSVATSPSTASFQWRYCDGSVWKSIRILPPASFRSVSAMRSTHRMHRSLLMIAKEPVGEFGCSLEEHVGRFAVRRVTHARQQRDLDRTVAFALGGLDLLHGA